MTGKTPLNAAGEYDLKLNGKLDLAVANPLFEARGMHVEGTSPWAQPWAGNSTPRRSPVPSSSRPETFETMYAE